MRFFFSIPLCASSYLKQNNKTNIINTSKIIFENYRTENHNINYQHIIFTGWWFQIFSMFTPKIGEEFQFDEHIFQMGWNHQLVWDPSYLPTFTIQINPIHVGVKPPTSDLYTEKTTWSCWCVSPRLDPSFLGRSKCWPSSRTTSAVCHPPKCGFRKGIRTPKWTYFCLRIYSKLPSWKWMFEKAWSN